MPEQQQLPPEKLSLFEPNPEGTGSYRLKPEPRSCDLDVAGSEVKMLTLTATGCLGEKYRSSHQGKGALPFLDFLGMVAPCPPLETVGLADLFLGRPRSRRYPKFNIRRDIPGLRREEFRRRIRGKPFLGVGGA